MECRKRHNTCFEIISFIFWLLVVVVGVAANREIGGLFDVNSCKTTNTHGVAPLVEPPGDERIRETALCAHKLTAHLGPLLPVVKERDREGFVVRAELAALIKPTPHGVLTLEILIRGTGHRERLLQALLLPEQAALKRPSKDAVTLSQQLFREQGITLFGWHRDRERNQVHATTHRLIDVANSRLVVARNQELELRGIGEEVLVHQTSRHQVTTRDGFDLGFIPASALLSFCGRDKASPTAHREAETAKAHRG